MDSISTMYTAKINVNVIDADVDVGTDATTWVYAVLFGCTYSKICENCSETRHF